MTTTAAESAPPEFPESTRAAIEANAKKWAARPMSDHVVIALTKIFNSVQ